MTTVRVDADVLADLRKDGAVMDAVEEIAASIEGIRETETLLVRLLDAVSACTPAERGAVLLAGRNGRDLEPAVFRGNPFAVNREICNSAFRDRTATLLQNSGSVLCAPLCLRSSNVGAIYLDAKRPNALTMVHLRLLIAIAAEAALPIDFTRHIDSLQVQQEQLIEYVGVDKGIIGASTLIVELLALVSRFAETESRILILGEMGTGKELVARAIHKGSRRKNGPFMAINCAAIPESLIASELFGYERGAFTGAFSQKIGKVEAANGGTLFLDEIAELTMPMQALMLRLIQEREFQRLGSTLTLHADIRIVAATNRDLKKRIAQGLFLEDLYYRLNVVELRTPALREIPEDIPALVEHFIEELRYHRVVQGISADALAALTRYHWPGNTRQLRNVIEYALGLCETGATVEPEHLPEVVWETPDDDKRPGTVMDDARRASIKRTLEKCGGDVRHAAAELGITPRHLWRLKRAGL